MFFLFAVSIGLNPSNAYAQQQPRQREPAQQVQTDRVALEVRVIEAKQGSRLRIDAKLKPLARDLKALPFREYTLIDNHQKLMVVGERMSFQFPGPGKKKERFLIVSNEGEKKGKLHFRLVIDALKFQTRVAVPNGGTIVVGGPRGRDGTIIFAVTARANVTSR